MIDYNEPFTKFITSHDPLISVVIPSYKKAEYLRECVESFIAQTYRNLEILVVNDGSPDDTSAVTKQLIAEYPQVKMQLLEKPNGGVSDARNFGLRRAAGRVVMTMDGDDKVKPTYLEKAVKGLRAGGGDIFRPNQENFGTEPGSWLPHSYDRFFIRYDNCFPTPSIFDKLLFEKTGGFKVGLGYAEDWEYWVSCSRHAPKVTQCDELLTCYRINTTGIQATFINGNWQDLISVVVIANEDLYAVGEVLAAHSNIPKSQQKSLERLRELDRIHPEEWLLKFFLGLLAEQDHKSDEACSLFSRAITLSGGRNWQPIFRLARLVHEKGFFKEAQGLLHETRTLRPDMSIMVNRVIDEIAEALKTGK